MTAGPQFNEYYNMSVTQLHVMSREGCDAMYPIMNTCHQSTSDKVVFN